MRSAVPARLSDPRIASFGIPIGGIVADSVQSPRSDSGQQSETAKPQEPSFRVEAPQLTLPKGGGALRAIAEKFGLNPVLSLIHI